MSHARHLRRSIRHHEQDQRVAFVIGWCADKTDVPATRTRTHDMLIGLMGDKRIGPVFWNEYTDFPALALLQRAKRDAGEERAPLVEHYDKLRDLLVENGGWLVVASAAGETPPGLLRR